MTRLPDAVREPTASLAMQIGDGWQFESPLSVTEIGGSDSSWFGQPDMLPFNDLDSIGADIDLTIRVKLPGKAIAGQHNATSVSGGEFTWDIDYDNPPDRLFAATEPSTGIPAGTLIVGAAVAAIALGVVGVLRQLTRGTARSATVERSKQSTGALAQVPAGQPVFDEAKNVWVVNDPARGMMWHHPQTEEWISF